MSPTPKRARSKEINTNAEENKFDLSKKMSRNQWDSLFKNMNLKAKNCHNVNTKIKKSLINLRNHDLHENIEEKHQSKNLEKTKPKKMLKKSLKYKTEKRRVPLSRLAVQSTKVSMERGVIDSPIPPKLHLKPPHNHTSHRSKNPSKASKSKNSSCSKNTNKKLAVGCEAWDSRFILQQLSSVNRVKVFPIYYFQHSSAMLTKLVTAVTHNGNVGNGINLLGNSALHIAVLEGNFEIVKFLIGKGVDIDKKGMSGNTPLHLAMRMDDLRMCQLLIQYHADYQIMNDGK